MKKFKIEDNVMVRQTFFPKDDKCLIYIDHNVNYLKKFLKKPPFKELLLCSNPSLYHKICYDSETSLKSKKVIRTLNNYINRMRYRATPFGLFSSVSLSSCYGNGYSKTRMFKKAIKPDSEWLYKVITRIENNPKNILNMNICWNQLAIDDGKYFKLLYRSTSSNNFQYKIHKYKLICCIYETTKKPIKGVNAVEYIINTLGLSNYSEDIIQLIQKLISKEFMLTDVSISGVNEDYFEKLLVKLESLPDESKLLYDLNTIKNEMMSYERTRVGNGVSLLEKINSQMKAIQESKNYLKIDLFSNQNCPKIEISLLNQLTDLFNFLEKVTPDYIRFESIRKYTEKFTDKYGLFREIPLLDLLDSEKGCGFPENNNSSYKNNDFASDIDKFISEKILECYFNAEDSIDLSNYNGSPVNNFMRFPDSLETYVQYGSRRDVSDTSKYIQIVPKTGSEMYGQTWGRFQYKFHIESESRITNKNYENVEIVEQSPNKRTLNVLANYNKNNSIAINTLLKNKSDTIELSEILVGVEKNNGVPFLFFKSKKTGKRLKFVSTSMVNFSDSSNVSNISKFLVEASYYNQKSPFYIIRKLESKLEYPYVPMIKYKNVIITPRRWFLNSTTITEDSTKEKLLTSVKRFINNWKIPNIVYVELEGDKKFLLNLNFESNIEELVNLIRKIKNNGDTISLYEPLECEEKYTTEYVISMTSNIYEGRKKSDNKIDHNNMYLPVPENSAVRKVILGDQWVSCELFSSIFNIRSIVQTNFPTLCKSLYDDKLINQFYYVVYRYNNDNTGLRIRFKLTDISILSKVISRINKWARDLFSNNEITRITFDTYNREIERYGGLVGIDCAERTFFDDSRATINFLKKCLNTSADKEIKIVMSLELFSIKIGWNFNSQLNVLLNRFYFSGEYKKVFVKNRSKVYKYKKRYIKFLSKNKKSSLNRGKNINETNKNVSVFLSLIHMHCNRLFVNPGSQELELMCLWTSLMKEASYYVENRNKTKKNS